MKEDQILYEKFTGSGQEQLKLEIALEAILSSRKLEEEIRSAYETYLKRRKRSAAELLERLDKDGFLWKEPERKQDLWGKVRWNLSAKYPYFASAFSVLRAKPGAETEEAGCDGISLFYPEEWEKNWGNRNPGELCRIYIHMVLHCLFGHILMREKKEIPYWDLASDIYVETVMEKNFSELFFSDLTSQIRKNALGQGETKEEKERRELIQILKKEVHPFQTENIYQYLRKQESFLEQAVLFHRDCHECWKRNSYVQEEKTGAGSVSQAEKCSRQRLELAEKWSRLRHQVQADKGQLSGRRGSMSGNQIYGISLKKKKKYDYRSFLEQFMLQGEEMQLDMESFDYIPYTYSRQHYENLVFLEPLEYAEVYKLKELIIAIDTSGSCRGKIVQQFLEETYQILSRRENFFREMRVHLIQCDSMIQEYVCIENQRQWKEYVKNLKVQGFGGTDFRPVFQLVEQLRRKKEIRRPGGLIYFTDGDGIYPEGAPDYDTAFVFLNDALKKGKIPSWAMELNLQISVENE